MRPLLAILGLLAACGPVSLAPPPVDVPQDMQPPCDIGLHARIIPGGTCRGECVGGWDRCGASSCSTNIDTDPHNCGGCGLDCSPRRCVLGSCAP